MKKMMTKEALNIQQVIDLLIKVRDKEGPNIKVVYIHSSLLCDYSDIAIDDVYSISVLEHPITNNKIVSLYCD